MKSCPECNRTFEDSFTFCLIDGSVLSAPFDLLATPSVPEQSRPEPPPTEVLKLEETKQEVPPTIASSQSEHKPEQLVSTIAAPAPAFESPQIKDTPAPPALKPSRSPLIMVGVGALLMLGLMLLITSNRSGSTNENAGNTNNVAANNTNSAAVIVSNSNQTSNTATPSPSPSPTPAVNLEGTVWRLKNTIDSRDYEGTLEFKQNGRIIDHGGKMEDGNWRYNTKGKWTREGDKVFMDFPTGPYFAHYKYEGTMTGEEISGIIDFLGQAANGTFTARLIK